MNDERDILRDILDGYHLCAVLGLTSPHAAAISDGLGAVLALFGLTYGRHRPAATLTATSAASAVLSALLH